MATISAASILSPYHRPGVNLYARGLLGESQPPTFAAGATIATQVAVFIQVTLFAGDPARGAAFYVNTAGTSTAPTGIYAGLYDSVGAQLAVSTNVAASSYWTAASLTWAQVPFGSTYTVPATGTYYVLFLQNGAFAGTALQLGRSLGNQVQVNGALSGALPPQYQQASQATPPSPATYATSGVAYFYTGVYY